MHPKALKIKTSYDIAFNDDGQYLATIGRDVSVWDMVSRKKLWRTHPFSHPSHVTYNPSGDTLAVKSTSGHIVLLDAMTGKMQCDFQCASDGEGSNAIFTHDGNHLINGTWKGRLQFRNVDNGGVEEQLSFEDEMVTQITHIPCQQGFAILRRGCGDSNRKNDYISLWDDSLATGRAHVKELSLGPLPCMAMLGPDSFLIGDRRNLSLLSPSGFETIATMGDADCFDAITINNAGRMAAGVIGDRVFLLNILTREMIDVATIEYACAVSFSPDNRSLAIGSWQQGMVLPVLED